MLSSGEELLGTQVTVSPGQWSGCIGVCFGVPMPKPGEVMKGVFLGHPSLPEPYCKLVVGQSFAIQRRIWGQEI